MSQTQGDLLLLLRLVTGRLTPVQGAGVRERMAEDQTLRQRWQRLAALNPDQPVSATDLTSFEQFEPDRVAAFVEGTLTAAETIEFEAACWNSEPLLAEVLSVFRMATAEETRNAPVPDALTTRLLQLGPAPELGAPEPPALVLTGPEGPARNGHTRHASSHSQRTRGLAILAGTVALIVAGLLVLQFVIPDRGGNNVAEDDGSGGEPKQDFVGDEQHPRAPQQRPVPDDGDREPERDPSAIATNDQGPPSQPPDNVPPQTPDTAPVNGIEWQEVAGIVAVREDDSQVWRGLEAGPTDQGTHYTTLPDSRALARLPDGTELVLGPDTEVSFPPHRGSALVRVHHGQAALRGLAADQPATFEVDDELWEMTSATDGTAVVMTRTGPLAELAVARGAVRIDTRRVRAGQAASRAVRSLRVTQAMSRHTAWLDEPGDSGQLPEPLQARLLGSNNVHAALTTLETENRLPTNTSRLWQFSLAPERTIYRVLNSGDARVRQQTLTWLAAAPAGAARTERIWSALGRGLQNETIPRRMREWHRAAQVGQVPTAATLGEMVRMLQHNRVAVRHTAVFYLRHFTRRQVGYDPDARPAQRQRAAQEWTRQLRAMSRGG